MVGIGAGTLLDRRIEAALRHDRRVVLASLAAVVGLAWIYLWREAGQMAEADMPAAAMPGMAHAWEPGAFVLGFAMWAIMMVGMMLPSAAPTILLYAALVRRNGERGTVLPAAWIFTSGYLAVWTAFSVAAALLQGVLHHAALLTPTMVSSSMLLSAAILVAAGVYQQLPLKEACLRKCRSPVQFFATRWRAGPGGAFRMGVEHGAYCVGCCWALMLLLFVAGVMSLVWVALVAAFVFVEKVLPAGRFTARFASVALVASGLGLLLVEAVAAV